MVLLCTDLLLVIPLKFVQARDSNQKMDPKANVSPVLTETKSNDPTLNSSDSKNVALVCIFCSAYVTDSSSALIRACASCCIICEDDYGFHEFATLRYEPHNLDVQLQHRKSTTVEQRRVLESVYNHLRVPSEADLSSLVLGLHWDKRRILKWFNNRRERDRKLHSDRQSSSKATYQSHKRPLFVKKKFVTGAHEKMALEAIFVHSPSPSLAEIRYLQKDLGRSWTHRRIVQWFTNRRKGFKQPHTVS